MGNEALVANGNAYQLQVIVFKQYFYFLFANKDYILVIEVYVLKRKAL